MQTTSEQTKIIICLRKNCNNEATKTKEGFQLSDCAEHLPICFWRNCKRKKTNSWLCKLHHLAKEASEGLSNTDPKKTRDEFYQRGVERLRDFAIYVIDEGII